MLASDFLSRTLRFCLTMLAVSTVVFLAASACHSQDMLLLHSFSGPDGSEPVGGLIADNAGNLYGTTESGGGSNYGTVFKLSQKHGSWVLSTLYSFQGGQDGASPVGRVVIGPQGALYGTTTAGGAQNYGTVFRLNPPATFCHSVQCPWTETVLYRFTGGADGAYPQNVDLAFDAAGNIYGTAGKGGQSCNTYETCGTVFQLTKSGQSWTETTLYAFSGGADGAAPFGGVTFDSAGNLYGTTGYGGTNGFGTVFELKPSGSGWSESVLHNFGTPANDGGIPFAGVIVDYLGRIYGTTLSGGSTDSGTAFLLTPSPNGWIYNQLASFSTGYSGPTGVLSMQDNVLLGVTNGDGANFSGNIFALFANGDGTWSNLDLFDFGSNQQYGVNSSGAVVVDSSFNVYGTAVAGGTHGQGVIFEYQIY